MSNIKIGRYDHESVTSEWSGWIEPEDGSWIIFTDADGKPALYFPERESNGAVIGEGIPLTLGEFEYATVESVA